MMDSMDSTERVGLMDVSERIGSVFCLPPFLSALWANCREGRFQLPLETWNLCCDL